MTCALELSIHHILHVFRVTCPGSTTTTGTTDTRITLATMVLLDTAGAMDDTDTAAIDPMDDIMAVGEFYYAW